MESDTKIIKVIKTKKHLFSRINNNRLDIYTGKTYINGYTSQALIILD